MATVPSSSPVLASADWPRRRLFGVLQTGGWCGLLLASPPLLAGAYEGEWWRALPVAVLRILVGLSVTTFLFRPCLRGWRRRGLPTAGLAWRLAALVGITSYGYVWFIHAVSRALGWGPTALGAHLYFTGGLLIATVCFLTWCVLYLWLTEHLDGRERELRLAQAESAGRDAELSLLRAQVNPHFLFNALNVIVAEATHDARLTRDTALALAEFLRYSLRMSGPRAPLAAELAALEHYLAVERARHGEQLHCRMVVRDDVPRQSPVPVAFILPLVENALKFAPRVQAPPWTLEVDLDCPAPGRLRLVVRNNGRWLAPEETVRAGIPSTGTGLANLRRRLELLHGRDAAVTVATPPGWVEVTVELPLVEDPVPEVGIGDRLNPTLFTG
jgi:hypothetical protein